MRKINWFGTLYLSSAILIPILLFFEEDNIVSCYVTRNYQVFVCDFSIRLFIFIIVLSFWSICTIYFMIDLFILDWEEN